MNTGIDDQLVALNRLFTRLDGWVSQLVRVKQIRTLKRIIRSLHVPDMDPPAHGLDQARNPT